jgi:hypothetical protein
MRAIRLGLLATLLLLAACGGSDEPAAKDFSSFRAFSFARSPGFGFCPPLDALFRASVGVDGEGVARLDAALLVGVRDEPGCPLFSADEDCLVLSNVARVLEPDELARLRHAFRAVRVLEEEAAECREVAIDPCTISSFRWDDFAASGFRCAPPRLAPAEAERVIDVVEDLARRPTCCAVCGDGVCSGDEGVCNCPGDCSASQLCLQILPTCGDGACEPNSSPGESHERCPQDCPLACMTCGG